MKLTNGHFILEDNEYIITPNSSDKLDYEIRYRGERVFDVVGVIRNRILERLAEDRRKTLNTTSVQKDTKVG